jgi:hypothetical protein
MPLEKSLLLLSPRRSFTNNGCLNDLHSISGAYSKSGDQQQQQQSPSPVMDPRRPEYLPSVLEFWEEVSPSEDAIQLQFLFMPKNNNKCSSPSSLS